MSNKLYLAAPLFSIPERETNKRLAEGLSQRGYDVFLPQSIQAPKLPDGSLDMNVVFRGCVEGLRQVDTVVAMVDGADADSGTAWELGYAYAHQVPTVCVRTDMRKAEQGLPVNLMIAHGTSRLIECNGYNQSLDEVVGKIVMELEDIHGNAL